MNTVKKKRIVKPGDIFQIDFGNNISAFFVAFKKSRAGAVYGGFFRSREDIEIQDYKSMMKKLVFYGFIGWDGIRNGEWKYVENLQLPEDFKLPPMRLLNRENLPDGNLGPLNISIVEISKDEPVRNTRPPKEDENLDELEDSLLYCGYSAAEKEVLARLKGKSLRLTIKEIEDDPNDLAIIRERRFAEAYDKYEKIQKYDDLRLLCKAVKAYIEKNNNIIPAFDSKNHGILQGDWDPSVNEEIKAALQRKWIYRIVPEIVGKKIDELDIFGPLLEVKDAPYDGKTPRSIDKRGVILYK